MDRQVGVVPAVERLIGGMPQQRAEVGVAHRHQPARSQHPPDIGQRRHRVAEVLEELVGVDHVERRRREGQVVHVGHLEIDLDAGGEGMGAGPVEHLRRAVDPDGPAGGDQPSQPGGDAARPASQVEQVVPATQMRESSTVRVACAATTMSGCPWV